MHGINKEIYQMIWMIVSGTEITSTVPPIVVLPVLRSDGNLGKIFTRGLERGLDRSRPSRVELRCRFRFVSPDISIDVELDSV
jgi:hypothetical protein